MIVATFPKLLLISFPKSGRTWLRYSLNIAGQADSIRFTHDGFEYNDGSKPSLSFDRQKRIEFYTKTVDRIVYLERDARDTIVSLYHQITGRFRDFFNYQDDISAFIRDPYFGVHNLIAFQAMWRELVCNLPVLVVHYEEMSQDYKKVLAMISSHFQLGLSQEQIQSISEQTTFDKMKDVELFRAFDQPWLQPRMGAPKMRKGKVGSYFDDLNATDIQYVESTMRSYNML